ncbi:MAG: class I SAM-dependent methyltransferase [Desulfomonile tiedjei]|uniref:Class I SAM-dependent methyltransferase n=1 Tax=Desulfomonile tiedjei TaxID=2358 RepID=A0A9D6V4X6_9BACT|nr:class I SAM-dependent methyltransferase [Desulfomonile tiedjei]
MEAHEYQTLFEMESSFWWFRALHLTLLDAMRQLGVDSRAMVLDAGCGTGQNLSNVHEGLSPNIYGFDVSQDASHFWKKRSLDRVCLASVNEIPFQSDTFDVVMSVDVLECGAVFPEKAYSEMLRVLKPGGHVIMIVPAYDWLMTPEHHKAVGAVRRYSRSSLQALLTQPQAKIVRMTHFFGLLLPLVAVYRLALRYFGNKHNEIPRSELKPVHPLVNSLLFNVVNLERLYVRKHRMPFGSSIMAVVRKAGE